MNVPESAPHDIPWLNSLRAAAQREQSPLLLALATADPTPHVRFVVCRAIRDDGTLAVTADARSRKHTELLSNPNVEAACWLAAAREQFRFAGTIWIVPSSDPFAIELWSKLSAPTRATFFWPDPGKPRQPDDSFPNRNDATIPPEQFEVLLLRPTRVDRLQLTPQPHRRTIWTLGDAWSESDVNP